MPGLCVSRDPRMHPNGELYRFLVRHRLTNGELFQRVCELFALCDGPQLVDELEATKPYVF